MKQSILSYLNSNTSLFRENFALGCSSDATRVTLVVFFICAFNYDMTCSLNALWSSMALRIHLYHTYEENLSSILMSNTTENLEDHSYLMPALLKRLTVLSILVHSLHTFTEAIASKH